MPKDVEEIIKAKTAGNNGLAPKKWTAQLEEIRKLLETQTGEKCPEE